MDSGKYRYRYQLDRFRADKDRMIHSRKSRQRDPKEEMRRRRISCSCCESSHRVRPVRSTISRER